MAAAEARAAWQRTANRCFVQEDAKRAPKLACCPSSSSKLQSDGCGGDTANAPDHTPAATYMPLNWNPANSNLPPDTKWWLQLQPNFGCQKDFTYEQLNASEAELGNPKSGDAIPTSEVGEEGLKSDEIDVDLNRNACSSLESHWKVSAACMKHDSDARVQELKAVNSNTQQLLKKKVDIGEYLYQDEELMDWEHMDQVLLKQTDKDCFDLGTPWIRSEKTEPWWRTADKDELASLVALKSLQNIENCDLPRPQVVHVQRAPGLYGCIESFDHDGVFSPSSDQKICPGLYNPNDYSQRSPASGSMDGKHWASSEVGHMLHGSEKLCSGTNSSSSTTKDPVPSKHISESDPSKAQLLEALRHSQTRAREAEKAAQQAYTEKEHVIKLFFRQASHLFAYKQWLQLLQLETICLQLKNKDHQISTLFPMFPWMPHKGIQLRKGSRHKSLNGKRGLQKHSIGKYAVAFAVGLSLASAGLLLGWTMGWLLPTL
eukprot:TRINITY_DN21568_c0_g1_i1.p1 TRINITY_DN21568_c0_g1~~TRINITY_DN21568_c0_g1_i1.p1  ORF type:complete len:488 (-),score=86.45 TRINITY_DN21568_c0_g1_i1:446-1909(-)